MTLEINGVSVPQPIKGGFTVTPEPIWSSNTGRTATGLMVGDIVATKDTISIEWQNLTDSEVQRILNAVKGKAFFSIRYSTFGSSTVTKTVYRGSGTPKMQRGDTGLYTSVTLQLIEQ